MTRLQMTLLLILACMPQAAIATYNDCMYQAGVDYLSCFPDWFEPCAADCAAVNVVGSCITPRCQSGVGDCGTGDVNFCVDECLRDTGLGASCTAEATTACDNILVVDQAECHDEWFGDDPDHEDCEGPHQT